jgi:chaperonin GroEL (HSP60 family)
LCRAAGGCASQQFLQDIALATGATLIDQDLGMMLQTMTPDMLGTASAATVNKCVVCCVAHAC